jgi:hypothetical protein
MIFAIVFFIADNRIIFLTAEIAEQGSDSGEAATFRMFQPLFSV